MDTCFVLESVVGARVRLVWHRDSLGAVDAVVLPGGFSYGDYLRSGALAAQSPVMQEVKRFAARGGPVLGICNGFQVLTETGLLPGQLARNPHLHFSCQTVYLRVEKSVKPFTSRYTQGDVLQIPIAHNEGRYYASQQVLEALEDGGQILFRYCSSTGELSDAANPNGSLNHIAGITNKAGNVLGMMPHPERASEALLGSDDGLPLFQSLLDAITTAAAR
jgi:phosphoribosylformylglycinamidine synthase